MGPQTLLLAAVLVCLLVALPPLVIGLVLVRVWSGTPRRRWLVPLVLLGGLSATPVLVDSVRLGPPPVFPLALSCIALPMLIVWPQEPTLPATGASWARLVGQALTLGVATGTYALGLARVLWGSAAIATAEDLTLSPPLIAVPLSFSALFAVLLLRLRSSSP